MKNSYTFHFVHLTTLRSEKGFIERFMVNSNERKNGSSIICSYFDLSFTFQDVRTLPTEDLENYFEKSRNELKKRLSFSGLKNYSELNDDQTKECVIESIFKNAEMEGTFWEMEVMFRDLCIFEKTIINHSYDIKVIHKHKIKIGLGQDENFILELKEEGDNTIVECFSYSYFSFSDPISIFDFLEKETEEAFFREVLKKTKIRRLVAPLSEE